MKSHFKIYAAIKSRHRFKYTRRRNKLNDRYIWIIDLSKFDYEAKWCLDFESV